MLVFLQKKLHRSLSDVSRYNQRQDTLDKGPLSNHRHRCRRTKANIILISFLPCKRFEDRTPAFDKLSES